MKKKPKRVKVIVEHSTTNKQEDRLAYRLWCKDRGIKPPPVPPEAIKRPK